MAGRSNSPSLAKFLCIRKEVSHCCGFVGESGWRRCRSYGACVFKGVRADSEKCSEQLVTQKSGEGDDLFPAVEKEVLRTLISKFESLKCSRRLGLVTHRQMCIRKVDL